MVSPKPSSIARPKAFRSQTESFEDLYRTYEAMVRRVLARLVPQEDLDDTVQEVFTKIYFALPKFRNQCKMETWIYRITINCSNDIKRKNWSWRNLLAKAAEQWSPKSTHAAETEGRLRWASLMQSLPEKHRSILVLHYLENQSIKELSEILQIPEGTAKSRLFTARQQLAQLAKEV